MIRFLHTADWQLGMTRHFLEGEAQARFTAARIEAIRSIGALAVAQDCAFVVVSGDVFETNQVDRQVVVRSLEAMKAFPAVTFYLLPGNHDPLDPAAIFRSATFVDACPSNVVVLDDTTERTVAPGVVVVGAPWLTKRPLKDLVTAAISDLPSDGTIRVVVGHGATDSLSPNRNDPAVIVENDLEDAIAQGRVHYVALGDRHSTTQVGGTGRVRYSGAPEPTDYDEQNPGNVLVVEIDGDAITVDEHRVGTWTFLAKHFDVSGSEDCELVAAFLDGLADKDRTIVKLTLVGQVSLEQMAKLEASLEHAEVLLAALERWERHSDLVALPDDGDFDHLNLTGFAADGLVELLTMGRESGSDAEVARDAIGLLYRLSGAAQ